MSAGATVWTCSCADVWTVDAPYSNCLPERPGIRVIIRTGTQQRAIIRLSLPPARAGACSFVRSLRLRNLFDYLMYQLKISCRSLEAGMLAASWSSHPAEEPVALRHLQDRPCWGAQSQEGFQVRFLAAVRVLIYISASSCFCLVYSRC